MKIILKIISVIIAVYVMTDAIKINVKNLESITFNKKDSSVLENSKPVSAKQISSNKTVILVSR